MKAALLGCFIIICVLVLAEAFPSPPESQGDGKVKVKLNRKKVMTRQEWDYDVDDIGSWSLLTQVKLNRKKVMKRQEWEYDADDIGRWSLITRVFPRKGFFPCILPPASDLQHKYYLLCELRKDGTCNSTHKGIQMILPDDLMDSKEMNETDCFLCCGTNITSVPEMLGTMDRRQGVPSNHSKRVTIPLVKMNVTDPLGAGNNRTHDRCFGCCFNATANATKETSEARQQKGTALPPIRSRKRT